MNTGPGLELDNDYIQIRIDLNYVDMTPGGDNAGHWYQFQHMDSDGYVK